MSSPTESVEQKLQLPSSCDPPGPHNPSQQRVWVVFGATGHMGRSVVKAALAHGDLVTAVGRTHHDTISGMLDMQSIPDPPPPNQTTTKTTKFKKNASSTTVNKKDSDSRSPYLPLLCDVRIRSTVDTVIQTTLSHYTRIDIIANCSGYGVIAACEDQDDFEIRNQFETNFWGTLHILQLSLPYFRTQKSGRYLIFSSTGGSLGVPGLGPFCATKYAVEGLIESMLYETAIFNIRATLVEPGHVRRDDDHSLASPSQSQSQQKQKHPKTTSAANRLPTYGHFFIKPASAPYASPTAPAGHAKRMLQWLGDRQPTSAVKAAELVWQLGHCKFPPLRLLLGGFAVESVRDRLRGVTEEIEDWKFLSFMPAGGGEGREEGEKGEEDGEEGREEEDEEEGGEGGDERLVEEWGVDVKMEELGSDD